MNPNLLFRTLQCLATLFFFTQALRAQETKAIRATRIEQAPRIDGRLTERVWKDVPVASGFTQNSPKPGRSSSLETQVKILYDDYALYIGAILHDVSPDSILREVTRRDQGGITDMFGVYFDPYDDDQNGFQFMVSAAGVQLDARLSPVGTSTNWNAAWRSEVAIINTDWYVEMEIPLSALRFPKKDIQSWGVNFFRAIRRKNEFSYWNEINPEINGFINQFGLLEGIENIKSPVRLQVSPYVSTYANHSDKTDNNPGGFSKSFNFGMDLKYGINDAFTLDMILVPDFGQVVSDNQVLNLSPFEVFFSENRQFFTEGTELFNKGDFFYSRRIGGRPLHYGKADDNLAHGEEVISNPQEASLLNASKISGRTRKGLGIGVLNAVTNKMQATIRNEAGQTRQVTTDPLTNYSVVAIDKSLKNNSYVTLLNTNVTRTEGFYDANVSGLSFRLNDKQNNFSVIGTAGVSHKFGGEEYQTPETGYTTSLTVGKFGGNFTYNYRNYMESDTYDPNDLGFLRANNEIRNSASVGYRTFEPFGKFLRMSSSLSLVHSMLYRPTVFTNFNISAAWRATFENFYSSGLNLNMSPVDRYDYFEPRAEGWYVKEPTYQSVSGWIGSDSRNRFRLIASMAYTNIDFMDAYGLYIGMTPRFRMSDKLSFTTSFAASTRTDDFGYVEKTHEEQINFGLRDLNTVTNTMTTKYTFNNRMDLFFRMRHYWSIAEYEDFFELSRNGDLLPTNFEGDFDRNFNAFNIDMVYTWAFAPASEISVVWKNAILTDNTIVDGDYAQNFSNTVNSPQNNSFSIRVLYLLDYATLMRNRKNRNFSEEAHDMIVLRQ